eukprot:GILK01007794.1.p1 GENE.GILK01007794.1~~GILK01007794.1.p1  ORF type:complete len:249 (-),score=17.81 GILK01007794.1:64-810(-)
MTPLNQVVYVSLLTSLSSAFGVVPLFFVSELSSSVLGICNCVAAGTMLSASAGLALEGVESSVQSVIFGAVLGVSFVILSKHVLKKYENIKFSGLQGLDARSAMLFVVVMAVHAFAEGLGIGVSFGGHEKLGMYISTSLAFHNIPEGLAVALVLVPKGVSVPSACLWAVVCTLPQALMAVPAFLLVQTFSRLLPIGLGFAASAMSYVAVTDLVEDARSRIKDDSQVFMYVSASSVLFASIQMGLKAYS